MTTREALVAKELSRWTHELFGGRAPGRQAFEIEAQKIAALTHAEEEPGLRDAVLWFAREMERQLAVNDSKGGWDNCSPLFLIESLRENVRQIVRLVSGRRDVPTNDEKKVILKAAADAANFALMLADNFKPYPPPAQSSGAEEPRIYPCAKCGTMRTKSEGGTTFTICDKCWDEENPKPAPPAAKKRYKCQGCGQPRSGVDFFASPQPGKPPQYWHWVKDHWCGPVVEIKAKP